MECSKCHKRKQVSLKRCKHFELGGDKKRKVRCSETQFYLFYSSLFFSPLSLYSFVGPDDPVLGIL